MSTITLGRLLAASIALAFILTGCSSTPTASVASLSQHDWSLVEATDADGHLDSAVSGGSQPPIQLRFQDGRMGVSNACNHISGDYSLNNDRLEVGLMMQTMMACEPTLMARENAIKSRLSRAFKVSYDQQADRLTLINDSGALVFQPAEQ